MPNFPDQARRVARSMLLAVAGATLAAALSAFATAEEPSAAKVSIDNFTFGPGEIIVPVGTTVTWVNNDDIPHTVVDTKKAFRSQALDTGDSFSFTFAAAGEYDYFCSLHPHMTGKVVVKAANP